jgi:Zn-dependent M28 family amino/carboxypeptidase
MYKYSRITLIALLLCCAISFPAQSAKISTVEDIERDVKLVPCKSSDRLQAVQTLFKALGATDADISIDDSGGTKNVIVTKKGSTPEVIVVGAHYDKVDDGCGAIDNWTGIVALAHLYGTLRAVPTKKTFKFIAFDKEEKGLIGSGNFVAGIAKADRASVCSMVNIDSFGFTIPWVMENASDKPLINVAKDLWKKMSLDLISVGIADADADSTSFKKAGIPAITFTGLDGKWQQYLHSPNDKLKNIKMDSVFAGYRIVLPYLVEIDKPACDAYRKK